MWGVKWDFDAKCGEVVEKWCARKCGRNARVGLIWKKVYCELGMKFSGDGNDLLSKIYKYQGVLVMQRTELPRFLWFG